MYVVNEQGGRILLQRAWVVGYGGTLDAIVGLGIGLSENGAILLGKLHRPSKSRVVLRRGAKAVLKP